MARTGIIVSIWMRKPRYTEDRDTNSYHLWNLFLPSTVPMGLMYIILFKVPHTVVVDMIVSSILKQANWSTERLGPINNNHCSQDGHWDSEL